VLKFSRGKVSQPGDGGRARGICGRGERVTIGKGKTALAISSRKRRYLEGRGAVSREKGEGTVKKNCVKKKKKKRRVQ